MLDSRLCVNEMVFVLEKFLTLTKALFFETGEQEVKPGFDIVMSRESRVSQL